MRGQNIGKALSLLNRIANDWDHDEQFGSAMGAPMGELRPIISKGRARTFRKVRRHVKALTGLKWRVFCDEVERRTNGKWVHFHSPIGHFMGMI